MTFKNYIFDLYGTLIDIHTDESDPYLWAVLAGFYSRFGADYTSEALKDSYHRAVREKQAEIREKNGTDHPEIKIENIFLRLFTEAPRKHKAELRFQSEDDAYKWTAAAANIFRELSMRRFRVFPEVHDTLKKLRSRGAKLYLLSNAQRVFTMPEIEKTGLNDLFDAIYISSDFGAAKPDPAFLYKLLNEQGLDASDCVIVGNDVRSDMAIATSCGVHGVFLNTDRHSDEEIDSMIRENKFSVIRSGRIEEILTE